MATTTVAPVSLDELVSSLSSELKLQALSGMRHGLKIAGVAAPKADSLAGNISTFVRSRTEAQRKTLSARLQTNLVKDTLLNDLLKRYPAGMPDALLKPKATSFKAGLGRALAPAFSYTDVDTLFRFSVESIRCVDETGSGWLGESGEDEIRMTGFGMNPANEVVKWGETRNGTFTPITNVNVGKFDDEASPTSTKRVKTYNPAMTLMKIPIGTTFPANASAVIQLIEVDNDGSIASELNKYVDKAAKYLKEKLTAWLGGNIGSALGPIVDAIAKAVKDFVKWLIEQIIDNDYFKPFLASISIPSAAILNTVGAKLRSLDEQLVAKKISAATHQNEIQKAYAMLPGGRSVATIKGHDGTYEVTYRLQVYFHMGLG